VRLDASQFNLLGIAIVAALVTHAPHLPLWIIAAMLVVMAARWLQRARRADLGAVPVWIRLPLTLLLPIAVIAQYGNLFGREPGSVLAVGMLVLKFTESEKPRDARAAATFACFVLMAALLFDESLVMTGGVALALLPQLALLRALEPHDDGALRPGAATLVALRRGLPQAALATLGAAPLALLAFLFLPRLAEPLWGAPSPDQGRTGVSDSMTPGGLAELIADDSPAFRVTFDAGEPPPTERRYWRGLVLYQFDGTTWTHVPSPPVRNDEPRLKTLAPTVSYEVVLQPTQQSWLFALDLPVSAPPNGWRNAEFMLLSRRPVTDVTPYRVTSAPRYSLDTLTRYERQLALSLPGDYNPRLRELAREWRERFPNDRDLVREALSLYNRQFTYTLTPPPLGRNSMDDFMFETRAGYCEHYSSSFTFLMRAAGIPARVVVGYQGGYWNTLGSYMVVRQSDAHAWSEIWREGEGWVRVDPTAAVSPERVTLGARAAVSDTAAWAGSEWLLALRNRWDLVNQLWTRVVVQFNALQQQNLLTQFGVDGAQWRNLAIALGAGSVLLVTLAMLWALRRDRDAGDAIDRAYRRLGRRLARAGLARFDAEGPEAYLTRLRQRFPHAAQELEAVFARYIALRYATARPDAATVRDFIAQVAKLRPG
jgi:transglutaminase-like putative cysteine protease